ncbi:MAG TPA: protein kinase [Terriglobales bacterium]|nr:protein kinase [Terriglobales bacterium]
MELPTNDAAEQQPSALGRYQIQEELGRGAMGAVYKAFDPVIARTVALKTILIDNRAPDRAQMVERLKQEAKAAGGLDHPNIITIYDVGEENDAIYLSMQYVQGTTLAALLADGAMPPLPKLLSWADQICAAVGFAHARGVIHRDLKPANLMVTDQGTIKVLDFGIAKIENTSLTQTGLVMGTPAYMSPEQIAGKKVDHRSDIFSLGAVFYELLTREKAFAGDIATMLYKIVNEHPVAPSIVNPAIPGGIDAVVRRALAKDPKDRFQNCEEMRQAFLEQSVRGPITSPAKVSSKDRTLLADRTLAISAGRGHQREPEPNQTRIWPSLMTGFAILFIAVAGWAFYVRSRSGSFPPTIAKFENQIKAIGPGNGEGSESTTPAARPADEHPVAPAASRNSESANAPATPKPTPAISAASNPAGVATLQPVAQSSGERSAGESVPASGTPATSPAADISQKPVDPSQTVSTQTAATGDSNQPAPDKAPGHDSAAPAVSSREDGKESDEKQNPFSAESRPLTRKRALESPSTVDGFSKSDVPDLLQQADAYAARGENRLARYEYGLVLKLDRNNARAREGLRRLLASWQSR